MKRRRGYEKEARIWKEGKVMTRRKGYKKEERLWKGGKAISEIYNVRNVIIIY